MQLNLPPDIAAAITPLIQSLPLDRAMIALVVTEPAAAVHRDQVKMLIADPQIKARPHLVAGLWLYVDELDESHKVSQQLDDETGSYWHGIMHRREGDFSNSHYWFGRAGEHPVTAMVEGGYDPHALIDKVEAADQSGQVGRELVETQRAEWAALFSYCAKAG